MVENFEKSFRRLLYSFVSVFACVVFGGIFFLDAGYGMRVPIYIVWALFFICIASSMYYVFIRRKLDTGVRALEAKCEDNSSSVINTSLLNKRRSYDIAWGCIMFMTLMIILIMSFECWIFNYCVTGQH